MKGGQSPIEHLANPAGVSGTQQRKTLDFIAESNREHLADRGDDTELSARIAEYELAFRMQAHAPEVVDLSKETEETKKLYGLDARRPPSSARGACSRGGWSNAACGSCNSTAATRTAGTRTPTWRSNHGKLCRQSDKPIAGLLTDLKRRGLLKDTLVIWGGEFGRTPMTEGRTGRDHNPHGFSMWLAGGGAKGGTVVGATDAIGLRAAEDKAHVHDFHATILHLLGFDHKKLTFRHNGRDERLTDNAGEVIEKALA